MSQEPRPQPSPKLILFVDDDEGMRAAVYGLLSSKYQVILAVDGADGFAKANEQPSPDLIISDIGMPRLDGIAMANQIRENETLRAIPIIFLTGQMSALRLLAEPHLGAAFSHVPKSANPLVLETKVRRALGEAA
jgi:two-component system chemotaxis response regulator CheY